MDCALSSCWRDTYGPLDAVSRTLVGLNEVNLNPSQLSWVRGRVERPQRRGFLFCLVDFRRGCSANLSKSYFSRKELSEKSVLSAAA